MIKVKLFTMNGEFVTEGFMPPFLKLPEIIIWGQRFFISPKVTQEVREAEWNAAEVAYVEGFVYALVPLQ